MVETLKETESIGSIIKRTISGNRKLTEALIFERLSAKWSEIINGGLTQHARVVDYKNFTLFVATSSSSWAQQIVFFREDIIKKYKKLYPKIIINEIKTTNTGKITLMPSEKKLQKDQTQKCPSCGQNFKGTTRECPKCQESKALGQRSKIVSYLAEAPWAKYKDLTTDITDIKIEETMFHQVKETLKRHTFDKLKQNSFDNNGTRDKRKLNWLKKEALKYVMLRTGLTPEGINDNIMQETLGKGLYKRIYTG